MRLRHLRESKGAAQGSAKGGPPKADVARPASQPKRGSPAPEPRIPAADGGPRTNGSDPTQRGQSGEDFFPAEGRGEGSFPGDASGSAGAGVGGEAGAHDEARQGGAGGEVDVNPVAAEGEVRPLFLDTVVLYCFHVRAPYPPRLLRLHVLRDRRLGVPGGRFRL